MCIPHAPPYWGTIVRCHIITSSLLPEEARGLYDERGKMSDNIIKNIFSVMSVICGYKQPGGETASVLHNMNFIMENSRNLQ